MAMEFTTMRQNSFRLLADGKPARTAPEMAEEALRELTAERIVARMTQETALHSRLQDQLREAEDEIAAAQERQRLRRQLEDRRPCCPCP